MGNCRNAWKRENDSARGDTWDAVHLVFTSLVGVNRYAGEPEGGGLNIIRAGDASCVVRRTAPWERRGTREVDARTVDIVRRIDE